jgi:CO/xanthine dehydrogenase FAD-binding subunit
MAKTADTGADRRIRSARPETQIFFPQNLNDLLTLCKQRPDIVPVAGGTWLLHNQSSRFFKLPEAVVSLRAIEELGRISRTESRIDIGGAAPVSRILAIGKNVLPPILLETLESIATPGIRSLATLGGNICIDERSMCGLPTLHILDARLEFRKSGGVRWVPVTHSRTAAGKLVREPEEILTRIRIPLENWNVQHFRRIGSQSLEGAEDSLLFSSIAKTSRGIIADLRFALGSNHPVIYRNRDLETHLVGRKIPLNAREMTGFLRNLEEDIRGAQPGLSDFLRERCLSLIGRLLSNLPAD